MADLTPVGSAYLRKPVSTLAITPKAGKITLLARKTWNVLLHRAQEAGFDKETHEAPLNEIVRGLDFNSRDLKIVKDHLRAMVSTTVEWQSPTTGETPAWTVSGLLAHAKLDKIKGEVWVEWSYAVRMRNELLDPDVYAKLSLEIISQFSTHAALVLYEIGKRYSAIGQTSRQPWQWWVPVLTGRAMDERTAKLEYRIFKRDYLRPALAEVRAIADLEMDLVEHKVGRFISELQFTVKKKVQRALALTNAAKPVNLELMARAERSGIEHSRAEQLAAEFGEEALGAAIQSLEKRVENAFPEPIRDPYRYLKSLMPGHAAAVVEEQEVREEQKSPEALAQKATEIKQEWVKQWTLARYEQIADEIEGLAEGRQEELVSQLLENMKERKVHPARLQCLSTKGWRHPMVRQEMISYYAAGAYGQDWSKPTAEQLLEIAAKGQQS
jgi:hypothetical protein